MGTIHLPPDLKEFLKLLNSHGIEYLLVGGYAVGYHGYPRATADLDVWVATAPTNALKLSVALREFGFAQAEPELFLTPNRVIRMGVPPLRIEILTSISGVEFAACFAARETVDVDGVPVNVIAIADLKRNKRSAGRTKDLADLEQLE